MKRGEIIVDFAKHSFIEYKRKNAISVTNISAVLIEAALGPAFVNESCKATEKIIKSQIIYRKLDLSINEIEFSFTQNSYRFLRLLKIFSRNRRLILSFDETEEPFYGELNKAEDNLYIHDLTYSVKGAKYGYKYLTLAITCNNGIRYIIDGIILKRGDFIEDYAYRMVKAVKDKIKVECFLFDRGFGWGIICKLKELNVKYMIFWKKQGTWYKKYFKELKDGESCVVHKTYKYSRDKSKFKVESDFILIKQLEYEGKKFDWIFATNLKLKSAENYVKRYKKRWGIETVFRVTDGIRAFTTSTNPKIRYFLFMFTCFVYNVWKFFQFFLGEGFTLANFCTNLSKFMIETGMIEPRDYEAFLRIFGQYNALCKQIKLNLLPKPPSR